MTSDNKIDLICDILDQTEQGWPDLPDVKAIVVRTLSYADYESGGACEISIVLMDDDAIRALNRDYRGKDKATNVLSFPQDEHGLLGDVIFALETIQREADEQQKSFHDHFTHMLVHGTLHLLGYDHIDAREAEAMEALEAQILETLNIKNPYASP